jgi:hypothetical protein
VQVRDIAELLAFRFGGGDGRIERGKDGLGGGYEGERETDGWRWRRTLLFTSASSRSPSLPSKLATTLTCFSSS